MKTLFKLLSTLFVCVLLFVGCEKDKTLTLVGTTQSYKGVGKAYLNNNYACWANGDAVKINGNVVTAEVGSTTIPRTGGAGTYVKFSGVDKDNGGNYYAIYPASIHTDGSEPFGPGHFGITLPSSITYSKTNGVQTLIAPMAAKADEDLEMEFVNLCALLKIQFHRVSNLARYLVVTSTGGSASSLSGTSTVSYTGLVPSLGAVSGSPTVTLDFGEGGVSLSTDSIFYVPVPAAALGSGATLRVTLVDVEGNYYYKDVTVSTAAITANMVVGFYGPTVNASDTYTFYEYIQSHADGSGRGSGYFQLTGIKPTYNSVLELTFEVNNASGTHYLAGSRGTGGGSGTQWFALGGPNNKNYFQARYCDNVAICPNEENGGWDREANVKYRTTMEVMTNDGGVTHYGHVTFQNLATGGTKYVNTDPTSMAIPDDAGDILLFALTTTNVHAGMKCYSFKVWEGGTLVANFIPCRKKIDNAPTYQYGMYNTVGEGANKFVQAVSYGTVPFSFGPEIH